MEGFGARIQPYRSTVRGGEELVLNVTVRNPFPHEDLTLVQLEVPDGWKASPRSQQVEVTGRSEETVVFRVTPPVGLIMRRARLVADLTVGGTRFGQHAEALVNVT